MTYIQAAILGIVQGLAEFLPISSSGHLALLQYFFGVEADSVLIFTVMMHVGRGIAVDRFGNPVRGLIKAKKEVENGNIILVHPEGTRTSDGHLGEFKDGAAYIAVKADAPLLPVYIEGGYQVWSRHMKRPQTWDKKNHRRKRITIHFGKPMLPSEFDRDAHKMTDAIHTWMKDMEKKDVNLQ